MSQLARCMCSFREHDVTAGAPYLFVVYVPRTPKSQEIDRIVLTRRRSVGSVSLLTHATSHAQRDLQTDVTGELNLLSERPSDVQHNLGRGGQSVQDKKNSPVGYPRIELCVEKSVERLTGDCLQESKTSARHRNSCFARRPSSSFLAHSCHPAVPPHSLQSTAAAL
eukprot:758463-Hanusia_phi.AAC.1